MKKIILIYLLTTYACASAQPTSYIDALCRRYYLIMRTERAIEHITTLKMIPSLTALHSYLTTSHAQQIMHNMATQHVAPLIDAWKALRDGQYIDNTDYERDIITIIAYVLSGMPRRVSYDDDLTDAVMHRFYHIRMLSPIFEIMCNGRSGKYSHYVAHHILHNTIYEALDDFMHYKHICDENWYHELIVVLYRHITTLCDLFGIDTFYSSDSATHIDIYTLELLARKYAFHINNLAYTKLCMKLMHIYFFGKRCI